MIFTSSNDLGSSLTWDRASFMWPAVKFWVDHGLLVEWCVFSKRCNVAAVTQMNPLPLLQNLSVQSRLSPSGTHTCASCSPHQCEQELSPAFVFGGESRPGGALKLFLWENGAACPFRGKTGILK